MNPRPSIAIIWSRFAFGIHGRITLNINNTSSRAESRLSVRLVVSMSCHASPLSTEPGFPGDPPVYQNGRYGRLLHTRNPAVPQLPNTLGGGIPLYTQATPSFANESQFVSILPPQLQIWSTRHRDVTICFKSFHLDRYQVFQHLGRIRNYRFN